MYRSICSLSKKLHQFSINKYSKSYTVNGSAFLSAIFTLTAGAFFLIGVSQLTRFIVAQNAVEQAVRSAAHILLPPELAANANETPVLQAMGE